MNTPIVFGIVGHSGTGKTKLLTALLPMLQSRGLRVAVLKKAHPDFEIDYPGKDSHILRAAGATQVLLASDKRWALIVEQQPPQTPKTLDYWLARLPPGEQDLVLVEGFKNADIAKLEIYRPELAKPLLYPDDLQIKAVASTAALNLPAHLDNFDLNDY